jgi:hypothetical protein
MKKRPYLHLAGDDPAQIFDDLERLRHEQGEQLMSVRRGRSSKTFARIPHDKALEFFSRTSRHWRAGGDAWLVLTELDRLILKSGGLNPVKLSSPRLNAVGIHSFRRMRALRLLEAAGVITVERRGRGRGPLVTHLWIERRQSRAWERGYV